MKAVIFDLDGTLWNAAEGVVISWNEVLREFPLSAGTVVTQEQMMGYMGKTMDQISALMFPGAPLAERQAVTDACAERENIYLAEHGGVLFPELEATLRGLKTNYRLAIVSNCQSGYIEAFLKAHRLGSYFDDFEMSGRTGLVKGENIRLVMERLGTAQAVYIGDTRGDEEAARLAGIPFIHAGYGFGTAEAPDAVIMCPAELPPVVERLLG